MLDVLAKFTDQKVERVIGNFKRFGAEEIWFVMSGSDVSISLTVHPDLDTIQIAERKEVGQGRRILTEMEGRNLGWVRLCTNTQGYCDALLLSGQDSVTPAVMIYASTGLKIMRMSEVFS